MSFETKLVYSEPLMHQTVFGYWRRRLGKRAVIAIVATAIFFVWLVLEDDESWLVIPVGAMLAMSVLMLPAAYLGLYRNLMRQIREVRELDGGNLSLDESRFTVSSRVATSTFDWSVVKELWQLRDVWLMLFSKSQFVILPTACLPAEMQAFILERVKSAGGKVN